MTEGFVVNMDLKQLTKVVTQALDFATRVHDELGPAGVKEIRLSPVGEMSLECDIRCEEAVLNALEKRGFRGRPTPRSTALLLSAPAGA